MTDKEISAGFARAKQAVNTMTLTMNAASGKIREAYAVAGRKINEAMRVKR